MLVDNIGKPNLMDTRHQKSDEEFTDNRYFVTVKDSF